MGSKGRMGAKSEGPSSSSRQPGKELIWKGGAWADLAPDFDDWIKLAKIARCGSLLQQTVGSGEGSIEGGSRGAGCLRLLEPGWDPQAHGDGGLLAHRREAGTGLG